MTKIKLLTYVYTLVNFSNYYQFDIYIALKMAMPKNTFWFRPGRLERSGRKNPGIMAVDDKFEFTVSKSNKEGSVWSYRCKYLLTPKIKCKAKAKVVLYDGKWVLQEISNNHECEPNRPRVIAEKLKHEMKELVRSDPVQPV